MTVRFFYLIFLVILTSFSSSLPKDFLILQSTTSTRDSGFLIFTFKFKKFNIEVRVIAVGTAAIKNSENCDADILIAHHKSPNLDD